MATMQQQLQQFDALFNKTGHCGEPLFGHRARSQRRGARESKSTGALRPTAARPAVSRPRAGPVSRSRGATCRRAQHCEAAHLCAKLSEATLTLDPAALAPKAKEDEATPAAAPVEPVVEEKAHAMSFVTDLLNDLVEEEEMDVQRDVFVDSDSEMEDDDALAAEFAMAKASAFKATTELEDEMIKATTVAVPVQAPVEAAKIEIFDNESACSTCEFENVACIEDDDLEADMEMEAVGYMNMAMSFAKNAVQSGLAKEAELDEEEEQTIQVQPVEVKAEAPRAFRFRPSVGSWLAPAPVMQAAAATPAANEAPTSGSAAPRAWNMRPSVGTWYVPLPKEVAPAKKEEKIEEAPKAFHMRPSVGTWFTPLMKKAEAPKTPSQPSKEAPAPVAFQHRPSVGTWFTPLTKKVEAPTTPSQPSKEAAAPVAFQHRPSVGTWFTPLTRKAQETTPAKPAAQEAEQAAPVKFNLRPSVGTWFTPLPKRVEAVAPKTQEVAPAPAKFQLSPSVGTWFTPLPKRVQAPAAKAEEATKVQEVAPAPAKFQLSPSVGTWFAPLPKRVQAVAPKAQEAKEAPKPQVAAPAKFNLSPSVGTWFVPRPNKVQEAAPLVQKAQESRAAAPAAPAAPAAFQLRPSVGTWYAPIQKKVQTAAPVARADIPAAAPVARVQELDIEAMYDGLSARPATSPCASLSPCSPKSSRSKRRIFGGLSRSSTNLRTALSIETDLMLSPQSARKMVSSPAGALRPKLKDAVAAFRMDDDSDAEETTSGSRMVRKSSLPNAYDALDCKFYSMEEKSEASALKRELPQLGELRPGSRQLRTSPLSRSNSASALFKDLGVEPIKAPVLGPLTPSRASQRSSSSGALQGARASKQASVGLLPMLSPPSPSSSWTVGPRARAVGSLRMGL